MCYKSIMPENMYSSKLGSVEQLQQHLFKKNIEVFTPLSDDVLFSVTANLSVNPKLANIKYGCPLKDLQIVNTAELQRKFPSINEALFCHREPLKDSREPDAFIFYFIVPPKHQWKYNAERVPYSPQRNYKIILKKKDYEKNLIVDPKSAYLVPDGTPTETGVDGDEYYVICDSDKVNEYLFIQRTYTVLRRTEWKKKEGEAEDKISLALPNIPVYALDNEPEFAKLHTVYVQSAENRFEERQLDNLFVKVVHTYMSLPGPIEFRALYPNSFGKDSPMTDLANGVVWSRNTMPNIIPPMPWDAFYREEDGEIKAKELLYEWEDYGSNTSDIPAVKKFLLVNPYEAAARYPTEETTDATDNSCCAPASRYVECSGGGTLSEFVALYYPNNTEEDRAEAVEALKARLHARLMEKESEYEEGRRTYSESYSENIKVYDKWRSEIEVTLKYDNVLENVIEEPSYQVSSKTGKKVQSKTELVKISELESYTPPFDNVQSYQVNQINGCTAEVTSTEYDDGRVQGLGKGTDSGIKKVPDGAITDTYQQYWSYSETLYLHNATDADKTDANGDNRKILINMSKRVLAEVDDYHSQKAEEFKASLNDTQYIFMDVKHDHRISLKEDSVDIECVSTGRYYSWTTQSGFASTKDQYGVEHYTYEITSYKDVVEDLFGITITEHMMEAEEGGNPMRAHVSYCTWKKDESKTPLLENLEGWTTFEVQHITVPGIIKQNIKGGEIENVEKLPDIYRVATSWEEREEKLLYSYNTLSDENLPLTLDNTYNMNARGFYDVLRNSKGEEIERVPSPFYGFGVRSHSGKHPAVVEVYYYPKAQSMNIPDPIAPTWVGHVTSFQTNHPMGGVGISNYLGRATFTYSNGDSFTHGDESSEDPFATLGTGYKEVSVSKVADGFIVTVKTVNYKIVKP